MPVNLASPGVLVREVDLTLGQVQTSTDKTAAIVSPFARGPVDEPVLIASESELLSVFGEPSSTDRQYEGWLTISSYLAYGGIVQVVRPDNDLLRNSFVGAGTSIKIKSLDDYNARGYDESTIPGVTVATRDPGSWGNGVKVAFLDGKADQILTVPGIGTLTSITPELGVVQRISKVAAGAGSTSLVEGDLKGIITGINTATEEVEVKVLSFTPSVGPKTGVESEVDYQQGGTWSYVQGSFDVYGEAGQVGSIVSAAPLDWFDEQEISLQGGRVSVPWNSIANRPTTTEFARSRNSRFDEFHIVIFDDTGDITGNAGTILEKNIGISKGKDAEFSVGTPSYWRKHLANTSSYLFGGSEPEGAVAISFIPNSGNGFVPEVGGEWDQTTRNTNFFGVGNLQLILEGGTNYDGGTDIDVAGSLDVNVGDIAAGYDNFESDDETNVDFLLMGSSSYTEAESQSLANKLIAVAELRKDAIAFISPYRSSQITDSGAGAQVTINSNRITDNIISFYSTVASSSYAVLDTGYKYMYDRFADKFRYVPLNGDIAGCCARTDQVAFPWFSPAGTTRGSILNGARLAYNPTQLQRDRLYSARVNPVIFANDVGGIVLFGDKTALSASSAFDRINVRRLFIYIEQAISAAAKDQLFEFNDEVTRTNFVNIVEPFLRDVQSKRGITDFVVVCDETNNTPAVIDRNEFVADIFVKPTRSINFIGLTFVATRTGVSFEEVIGTV